jgi:hypothetical protein
MCNNTKQRCNKCGVQVSVGEEVEVVAAAGLVLGQAGGLSVIYLHGKDQDGCLASEEEQDGGVTLTSALASHGFRGGGGPAKARHTCKHHNKSCNLRSSPYNSLLIQAPTDTPTRPIRSTPTRDTDNK